MSLNAGWVATSGVVAGTSGAKAAKAAVSGRQHVIYALDVTSTEPLDSLSGVTVDLNDGTTILATFLFSGNELKREFPLGVALTIGNAANLVVSATPTGGGSIVANLHGNTR